MKQCLKSGIFGAALFFALAIGATVWNLFLSEWYFAAVCGSASFISGTGLWHLWHGLPKEH